MTTLYLPPYPFPIRVFTNKEQYKKYALKHGFFEKPVRDVKDIDENLAEVIDSDNNPELGKEILMHLPPKGELSEFDFEETIDHEVIHVVFCILRWAGSKVGMKYTEHEHFVWHVNYLDREIKTKVYGEKDYYKKED